MKNNKDGNIGNIVSAIATASGFPTTPSTIRALKAIFKPLLTFVPEKLIKSYVRKSDLISSSEINAIALKHDIDLLKEEKSILLSLLREQLKIGVTEFSETYETIKETLNEFSVYNRTLEILSTQKEEDYESAGDISDHWYDNFQRFAKQLRNEPWRNELLSNCFAEESKRPNSISNRAVWNIAMLDEQDFYDMQDFIKYSCSIKENGKHIGYYMVGLYLQLTKSTYKTTNGKIDNISNLFNRLESIGLFTLGNGAIDLWCGKEYVFELGSKGYLLQIDSAKKDEIENELLRKNKAEEFEDVENGNQRFSIFAQPLSPLGNTIAKLGTRIKCIEAEERFEKSILSQANQLGVEAVPIHTQQG